MLPGFPSTRAEAWRQWQIFLPSLDQYSSSRNRVESGHAHVSRLSPAFSTRLLTEDEVMESIRSRHRFGAVEKFVQELHWRRYWKAWLEHRPAIWAAYRQQSRRIRNEFSTVSNQRIAAVESGESGVAVMDRFARELRETGYLHNHARMWWASFWIHVERLPWQLGADFFFRHLLDADAASNTLSWRWVAGLQTPGKTYLVRRSNLEKYVAPDWLDPAGLEALDDERVAACPAIIESELPSEYESVESDVASTAPHRWGLWLHHEDLSPESGPFPRHSPSAVYGFSPEMEDATLRPSPLRTEHLQRALADGVTRAGEYGNFTGAKTAVGAAEKEPEHLGAWVKENRLEAVWAFRPFIGPLQDALPEIAAAVRAAGAKLVLVTRESDEKFRPHARRGYFPFWEKVRREVAW